jgi:hypothetical protein
MLLSNLLAGHYKPRQKSAINENKLREKTAVNEKSSKGSGSELGNDTRKKSRVPHLQPFWRRPSRQAKS